LKLRGGTDFIQFVLLLSKFDYSALSRFSTANRNYLE